jgi:hypothetical protein
MLNKRNRTHQRVPVVSLRASVDANCAGQDKLRSEISLLESGPQKAAAQKQLTTLGTNLLALNVEISLHLLQTAGQA